MIVSNSTPISNLLHINHIYLLQNLFKEVYIPVAVADELNAFFKNSPDFQDCLNNHHIIIKKAKNIGYIPVVKVLMDILRSEKHFWIDKRMYQKVLSLAGE
jgi:predicted nucleic acid-binding protein